MENRERATGPSGVDCWRDFPEKNWIKGWLETHLRKSRAGNSGGGRVRDTQEVDRISACLELGQERERKRAGCGSRQGPDDFLMPLSLRKRWMNNSIFWGSLLIFTPTVVCYKSFLLCALGAFCSLGSAFSYLCGHRFMRVPSLGPSGHQWLRIGLPSHLQGQRRLPWPPFWHLQPAMPSAISHSCLSEHLQLVETDFRETTNPRNFFWTWIAMPTLIISDQNTGVLIDLKCSKLTPKI